MKQVHSNAIVFGGTDRTLGIGAGQMSRVDSAPMHLTRKGHAQLADLLAKKVPTLL